MQADEYIKDPCRASSLPFWKTEMLEIPKGLLIIREDCFLAAQIVGRDEPYFKMIHHLESLPRPTLSALFIPAACSPEDFARHINACYQAEGISPEALRACQARSVYDPDLWIAVLDRANNQIAASGIADLDARIGEGVLEWIQVSPEYRRRGLGTYIVCELLRRMQGRASFASVSGRLNNPCNPFALYRACGFVDPVIWHVLSRQAESPFVIP